MSLVARHLEEGGISTVIIGSARDVVEHCGGLLPSAEEVVFGGPMSANDEHDYIRRETDWMAVPLKEDKPLLGICLGAQLMARALDAPVTRCASREIGWFPVQGVTRQDQSTFRFPSELDVFHWHGETFTLPNNAVHLAASKGCTNQAFQIGNH